MIGLSLSPPLSFRHALIARLALYHHAVNADGHMNLLFFDRTTQHLAHGASQNHPNPSFRNADFPLVVCFGGAEKHRGGQSA